MRSCDQRTPGGQLEKETSLQDFSSVTSHSLPSTLTLFSFGSIVSVLESEADECGFESESRGCSLYVQAGPPGLFFSRKEGLSTSKG